MLWKVFNNKGKPARTPMWTKDTIFFLHKSLIQVVPNFWEYTYYSINWVLVLCKYLDLQPGRVPIVSMSLCASWEKKLCVTGRFSVPMCSWFLCLCLCASVFVCVSSSKGVGRLCCRQRYVVGGESTDISAGTSRFPSARIQCLSLWFIVRRL